MSHHSCLSQRLSVAVSLVVACSGLMAGGASAFAAHSSAKKTSTTSSSTSVATSTTAPATPARAQQFGITAGCCTPVGVTLDDQVQGYAATHAGWARIGFDWSTGEPTKGSYSWTRDAVTAHFASTGMKVLGVIAYSPKWAADPTCFATYGNKCPPLASSDFARYAAALAERYDGDGVNDAAGSPRVDAWEVWNEPNLASYWRPQPDPQAYTSLLASAYTAIHAAAPAVTVVSAGLSPAGGTYAPIKFLAAMYLDGAHGSFDALGFHPYSYPALPTKVASWNAWQQMFQAFPTVGQPDTLRSLMVANGDEAKKIWATEYGAPTAGDTNGDGVSNCDNDGVAAPGEDNCLTEAQQAVMVTTAYTQWRSYTWAGPLFWYAYQDLDTGSLNIEKNFGLVRSDGSQKPAYAVYTNAAYAALPAG
jgi:polysaccharide biosynthesis protein PslG